MIEKLSQLSSLSLPFYEILIGIYGLLILFTVIFYPISKKKPSKGMHEIMLRIYSWWAILFLITIIFHLPGTLATITVALLTFGALREYLSHVANVNHYRRTLFYVFLTIPIQFYLAKNGSVYSFNSFIPVYMFFFIPIRNILSSEYKNYLEFNGKIFWALMLVVYGFSQITFLRHQNSITGYKGGQELIILIIVFLTQFNDVLQFLWGKSIGKHKLSPVISPNKTIEGYLGGALTLSLITFLLRGYLPFNTGIEAAIFGFLLSTFGLFGDLNMSAIKRDLGIKDMDDLIPGHGGILDRLDSLSFALPFTVHYLLLRGYL